LAAVDLEPVHVANGFDATSQLASTSSVQLLAIPRARDVRFSKTSSNSHSGRFAIL
jgi:hypothetical protein